MFIFTGTNFRTTVMHPRTLHPSTLRPRTIRLHTLHPDVSTSPYVSSLNCQVCSIPEKTQCHWKCVWFVHAFVDCVTFWSLFFQIYLTLNAISPIFNSAWIFSDRRVISADYRTVHPVHCKEKTFSRLFIFFITVYFYVFSRFDHKPMD